MKGYLKQFDVWEILVNPPNHPRRKTKASFEKDNKVALNFLMDGLSSPIKKSLESTLQIRIFGSTWKKNAKGGVKT